MEIDRSGDRRPRVRPVASRLLPVLGQPSYRAAATTTDDDVSPPHRAVFLDGDSCPGQCRHMVVRRPQCWSSAATPRKQSLSKGLPQQMQWTILSPWQRSFVLGI
ncbi:hypothetical protein PMIN03_011349 [Paraphaeosphaeria minitans]